MSRHKDTTRKVRAQVYEGALGEKTKAIYEFTPTYMKHGKKFSADTQQIIEKILVDIRMGCVVILEKD